MPRFFLLVVAAAMLGGFVASFLLGDEEPPSAGLTTPGESALEATTRNAARRGSVFADLLVPDFFAERLVWSGVSLAKLVASMEVPASHQGRLRPATK